MNNKRTGVEGLFLTISLSASNNSEPKMEHLYIHLRLNTL
jgi:hypothetical protein